jgi:hypothetical protein
MDNRKRITLHSRIIECIKKVRLKPISEDELAITMEFARPLASGPGVPYLFLLLQPPENHP